ncbi:hypothetical protein LI018_22695 [Enterocloster bolteae]|uniref:DUF6550 family protein n=1 Tax=Clostridia TaxID=186801 RepID=UPI000CCFA0AD|nr:MULTISPECIES: DUF6550 family protein [Clostridia]MBS6219496.1 hypothetical protein [[Clostridium] symbiosum]MCB6928323.1 hypothetical protein [Enterocloster bolteae]PNV63082.1 hypothetical protein C0033_06055 [Clostridium sp. chh4-2]
MKRKHKQMLLIAGCAVACIVLVAVIGSRFGTPSETTSIVAESSAETEGVTVAMEPNPEIQETSTERETEETPEETKEIVIQTESVKPAETRETKAAVPVQTDQKEQAIQPSPEKPTAPPEEVLSDPTQKPDGEKVEGTPVAEEHEAVVPPSEPPVQAGEPQYWDTQDGKIYVPGFGWIDEIGEGQGTVAEDMYENGNKIGIMD